MNSTEKRDTGLNQLIEELAALQTRAVTLRTFINSEKLYTLEIWEQADIREQLHFTESLAGVISRRIRRTKGIQP